MLTLLYLLRSHRRRVRRLRRIIIGILLISSLSPDLSAQTYSISKAGIEMIKTYESCRLQAYPDAAGWSIGYGHHGKDVQPGMTITQNEAERLLQQDITEREASVRRLIEGLPYQYTFHQDFIDALYSLVYNCGENRIRKSEFYRRLQACDPRDFYFGPQGFLYATEAVLSTAISEPGLSRRRESEYLLMTNNQ